MVHPHRPFDALATTTLVTHQCGLYNFMPDIFMAPCGFDDQVMHLVEISFGTAVFYDSSLRLNKLTSEPV